MHEKLQKGKQKTQNNFYLKGQKSKEKLKRIYLLNALTRNAL